MMSKAPYLISVPLGKPQIRGDWKGDASSRSSKKRTRFVDLSEGAADTQLDKGMAVFLCGLQLSKSEGLLR
jgi:hypothetical protein